MQQKKSYALVTGGSRGIGRAISLELANQGHHVLVNFVSDEAAANETVKMIKAAGGDAQQLQFSVKDLREVEKKLSEWKTENGGHISILVNNAGILKDGLMMWMSENDWNEVVDTSLKGFYNVTRQVLQHMLKARHGRIINIVSLSGLKGVAGQVNYSAAKGGVIAATKALAQEVAKRKVTVNAIAPGFIETDMTKDLDKEQLLKFIPAARFGTADEVAALAGFLASEKAAYITGEVININGGLYS